MNQKLKRLLLIVGGGALVLTIMAGVFASNDFGIYDPNDQSKIVTFDVSNITTGTHRTIFLPDQDGTPGLTDNDNSWTGTNVFVNGLYSGSNSTADNYSFVGTFGLTLNYTGSAPSIGWHGPTDGTPHDGLLEPTTLSGDRIWTLPDASGTIALTSNLSSYQPLDADLTEIAGVANVRGDLLVSNSSPSWVALAKGAAGTWLRSDGTDVAWSTTTLPNSATAGDLPYASGSNAYGNLAIGTSGKILTSSGSAPQWSTNASVVDVARSWTGLQTYPDNAFKVVGSSDASKTLVFENDAASVNADLVLNWAGTGDATVTAPNSTGTLPNTVAPTGTTTDKTGQTGSISTTTVYTTTHAGFYRVECWALCTAFTSAGQLTASVIWTDAGQAHTAGVNMLTFDVAAVKDDSFSLRTAEVTTYGTNGTAEFYATSGTNIRYFTTKVSGTYTYSFYIRVVDES